MYTIKYFKSLALGLLLLSLIPVNGQEDNSLLWQISGSGLEKPSYLFGTIHVICPDDLVISDKILNALKESEQLVLELDMDDPAFMQEMQQVSVNDNMANLSSKLSEKDLETLNSFLLKHYQADMSQLGILKPFALLSMMFMKSLDCPQPGSYEQALVDYSKQQDWAIQGLESIQDQIAVFDAVSTKEQLGWLVAYAANEDNFQKRVAKMLSAYKSEDINKLLALMKDYPEYKNIEETLLYERNEKWISDIIAHATEKPTFFAVGAAHLASDRGVIELLKEKGFTLTPIIQ